VNSEDILSAWGVVCMAALLQQARHAIKKNRPAVELKSPVGDQTVGKIAAIKSAS